MAIITGDNSFSTLTLSHTFDQTEEFPTLVERKVFKDAPPVSSGVIQSDVAVEFSTTISLSVVSSGAGYNNSLGAYTVAADGTIQAVSLAFTNVKDPLATANIADNTFNYNYIASAGSSFGVFLIADGDNANKDYSKYDLVNGQLSFVYRYGKKDERPANISDNGKDIALVYTLNGVSTVLKGDIYHTTYRGEATNLNADNKVHTVSGLVDEDNPTLLRVGFEDLKNLGDADYNDVVIDIKVNDSTVSTGTYNDTLNGTAEDDIIIGGLGFDYINGQAGVDVIDYSAYGQSIIISLGDGSAFNGIKRDTILNVENATGSAFSDRLAGDNNANALNGLAGNDVMFGMSGDDTLNGGDGDDEIYGDGRDLDFILSPGDDTIDGGNGNDVIVAGDGDDVITGGLGNDKIFGGNGRDTVIYTHVVAGGLVVSLSESFAIDDSGDRDTLYDIENVEGSGLADRLAGNASENSLHGNGGNDELIGEFGDDELSGGAGDDVLYGDFRDDVVTGGNDRLSGGEGNDRLVGGAGDDVLDGGLGADVLIGGAGQDTADYSNDTQAVIVDLSKGLGTHADGARDALTSIENVRTTALNDTVVGNEVSNVIYGEAGADTLYGGAGTDTLYGGAGNDLIYGDFKTSSVQDANDILFGGDGVDTLLGGGGNDHLTGDAGNDTLWGGTGMDTFHFTTGGGVDLVRDFSLTEGDKLDISNLLAGYFTDPLTQSIEDFVRITTSGANSVLAVDVDGGANSFVTVATISAVTGLTDENALYTSGHLVLV